ncbi:MAG: hypothetical protein JWM90_1842, partial [Thermoleophilia bacterium]|nr:hypothetical protein [Thermoleophilia bacterium]
TIALVDRSTASGRLIAMGQWASGNQFQQYYSDDDGATWTLRAVHPFSGKMRYLGGARWTGGNRLNPMGVTSNDGDSWSTVTMGGDPSAFLNAISAERGGAAMAVGDGSSVYRTTDSGASWSSISPVYPAFRAVVPFSAEDLAIVGSDGSAHRSSDAGVTLVAATGCGGANFTDGVATGATTGVVVGGSGKICRTTDSGQTWQDIASGTASHLTDVVRARGTGLLIAHGAHTNTFQRSTDDGLTWQPMSLPVAGAVGEVAVDADASTIAIGKASNGQLWVSEDAGATFASVDDGVASAMPSLAVSPSGTRIIAGHFPTAGDGFNRLATSTTGGSSWSNTQVNGGIGDLIETEFVTESRLVLFVAGTARKVMVSDDAGASFTTSIASPGGTELDVLDANTFITSGIGKLLNVSKPADSVPNVVSGTGLAGAGGAFGACLLGTTNATPSWPSTGTCSSADASVWRGPAADSAAPTATIATTPGGTASADLVFGLLGGAGQQPGTYSAHLVYDVVAP